MRAAAVLLSWSLLAANAAAADFDDVMQLLAQRRQGHAEFIEQQFLAVLDRPLESSGELRYQAPDHLEKITLKPHLESLVLNGGSLSIQRGKSRHVLDLQTYPQIQPLIECLRATMAGDRAALERLFKIAFNGSIARWTMNLTPLNSGVLASLAAVRIEGARDELLKVEIRQRDGDRSLMTLRPAQTP